MNAKKKKKRSLGSILISLICIIVIIASAAAIFLTLYPKYKESQKYKQIQQVANNDSGAGTGTFDWEALKAINPDIVGWITVPGTHIDYPVVQTNNNDFYLVHNFERKYSGYGTPFLDYQYDFNHDPKPQNAVIYAHNSRWGDEIGFEGLEKYEDQSYFYDHPTIYYTTIYDGSEPVKYEVVAAIKENFYFDYRRPDFADQSDFLSYYNGILSRKLYETEKGIYADDQLVTLSSCVFDMDNGRVALIARRV